MTRSIRLTAVLLTAATLAISGCRTVTHTTVVEPVQQDHHDDHHDDHHPPPPPPPDHRDDHR